MQADPAASSASTCRSSSSWSVGRTVTSGLLELYFSYREQRTALTALQTGEGDRRGGQIAHFIDDTRRQIEWTIQPVTPDQPISNADRRAEYLRLLRARRPSRTSAMRSRTGATHARLARLAQRRGQLTDAVPRSRVRRSQRGAAYFGPVYFESESEPYMRIALRDPGAGGVVAADVNLKFIWDVVSRIRVGQAGYAYVVDRTAPSLRTRYWPRPATDEPVGHASGRRGRLPGAVRTSGRPDSRRRDPTARS